MLEHDLARGRLPQTLLLYGPPSSGKFLTAWELARVLSCREGAGSACACASCASMWRLQAPNLSILSRADLLPSFELWKQVGVGRTGLSRFIRDAGRLLANIGDETRYGREAQRVRELLQGLAGGEEDVVRERAGEIVDIALDIFPVPSGRTLGIDQVREVQRFVHLRSGDGRPRVVIVDGAESMTEEASNSFLRIAEDPPPGAYIILVAVDRKKLKDTVVSRSRCYRFTRMTGEDREAVLGDLGLGAGALPPREERARAMEELLGRLEASGNDLYGAYTLVLETAKRGEAPAFVDYLIEELGRAGRHLRSPSPTGELGAMLKRLSGLGSGIRYHHLNAETALADFLLNSLEKYVHLKKQLTQQGQYGAVGVHPEGIQ